MLLSITTTSRPATDLGHLLHKNPSRVHSFEQVFGKAHVFYPEIRLDRCTAALVLDVDPIGLVRNRRGPSGEAHMLEEYVNDRPYAASSFLSVAIARTFGTAMTGKSKERQELADTAPPLEARIAVLPCRGGESLLRKLFEPLGYEVAATRHSLDSQFPNWGESAYFTVTLKSTIRWEDLTSRGGEGMVVKPLEFVVRGRRGLTQPAIKRRGSEYLRIIYGPEYLLPENLERLRSRSVSTKRSLALRECALGIEAIERFVRLEPLRRVHECVFGVLALESEPVDPRL